MVEVGKLGLDRLVCEPLVAEVSRISAPIGATAMLAGCAAVAPTGACVNQVSTALCRRCRVESGAVQLGSSKKELQHFLSPHATHPQPGKGLAQDFCVVGH
jgi:hypothetical protein